MPNADKRKGEKAQKSADIIYGLSPLVPKSVPRKHCHKVPRQKCTPVPKRIPKEHCRQIPKQRCDQVPKRVPVKVPREVCEKLPREECEHTSRKVPKEIVPVCSSYHHG